MNKRLLLPLPPVLALTVLSGLAFANNLAVIVRWWRTFLATGGAAGALGTRPTGILPFLDWSAVDYSAVTTFIPFLGFLCLTVSLLRLLGGHRFRAGDFPFFRGSDQLNVALGLFGTLWGIIVIGFYDLGTVGMADLMQCLHTALFSTLMAVVWVFMIDRPLVRPYFTRLLETSGLAETDDGDLAAAVDRLVVRLGVASDAFDRRQVAFEKAFAERSAAYQKDFETRLAAYQKEFDARQREYAEFFTRRIAELESRAASSEKRLAAVAAALRAAFAAVSLSVLAGCFTICETPYPKTEMTRPSATNATVAIRGFETLVTEFVTVSGLSTVYVDGGWGRRDWYGPGGWETVPVAATVARPRETDAFREQARNRFEAAGWRVMAQVPDYLVEVRFSGPNDEPSAFWRRALRVVGTIFFSDRAVMTCHAKLKIYDNRTGKLLHTSDYDETDEESMWSPVPVLGPIAYEKTSPERMRLKCLSALTDRATADASAFLARAP